MEILPYAITHRRELQALEAELCAELCDLRCNPFRLLEEVPAYDQANYHTNDESCHFVFPFTQLL
ncbi:hypothetical protein D3C87_637170 [compost metagenome]